MTAEIVLGQTQLGWDSVLVGWEHLNSKIKPAFLYSPHALPITCGRRAAVEGREGSGDCDEGGLATDPDLRLSSGCCVGPELIEGESCVFEY